MSEAKTIARPYAVAVWRHAQSQGKEALWVEMLELMSMIVSHEKMSTAVNDPRVDADVLSALMLEICGGRINEVAEGFIKLLVANDKLVLMPEIAAVFNELRAEAGGAINATLTAAYAVNAKFEQAIAKAMQKRLNREVNFTTEIDKSLLGGVIIRAGDMVIDASIRGQIDAMAVELRS